MEYIAHHWSHAGMHTHFRDRAKYPFWSLYSFLLAGFFYRRFESLSDSWIWSIDARYPRFHQSLLVSQFVRFVRWVLIRLRLQTVT